VRMEEVAGIPRLPKTPGAVIYAPLGDTPVDPDVVLVAGQPALLMRLLETAVRAGIQSQVPFLGVAPGWPAGCLHAINAVCVGWMVKP